MLTRRKVLAGLAALPLAGPSVAGPLETRPLTVAQMREKGGLIVDIRRAEEWAETGVIEGARLLTFDTAQAFVAALGPDLAEGQDLILVCRSGHRSALAAEALAPMLPNRIISVEGGMARLIADGYRPVPPQ